MSVAQVAGLFDSRKNFSMRHGSNQFLVLLRTKSIGYAKIDIFNLIVETKLAFDR